MASAPQHVLGIGPVTALACFGPKDEALLAAEGPFLKFISRETQEVLSRSRIFQSQPIHGIIFEDLEAALYGRRRLVLWGGSRIRIVYLGFTEGDIDIYLGPEYISPGWVLNGGFAPLKFSQPDKQAFEAQAALVTARNALLLLRIPFDIDQSRLEVLSASYYSILYSAHLKWVDRSRLLLASGTAFGEILLWSCIIKPPETPVVRHHHWLRGHEGSVFGVNISDIYLGFGLKARFLASCSDDRTIRIWDISTVRPRSTWKVNEDDCGFLGPLDSGFGPLGEATSQEKPCDYMIATAWGHASRIWGIRFTPSNSVANNRALNLCSFGEDATCQYWRLSCKRINESTSAQNLLHYGLQHQGTMSFHSGRNIWSMASSAALQSSMSLGTGGADGKIAWFTVDKHNATHGKSSSIGARLLRTLPDLGLPNAETLDIEPTSQLTHTNELNLVDRATEHNVKDVHITQVSKSASQKEVDAYVQATFLPSERVDPDIPPNEFESFKSYSLIGEHHILAVTNRGSVFLLLSKVHDLSLAATVSDWKKSQEVAYKQDRFSYLEITRSASLDSYSIIITCREHGISFLAGSDGTLFYFRHKDHTFGYLAKMSAKISNMLCQGFSNGISIALSCLRSPDIVYWNFMLSSFFHDEHNIIPFYDKKMKLPPNTVITSMAALETDDLLVFGARTGAVLVYQLPHISEFSLKEVRPITVFKRIHSGDAVTSISSLRVAQRDQPSSLILTTGRNGTYAVHELRWHRASDDGPETLDLVTLHASSLHVCPMIEGAYVNNCQELILYGFHGKHFVVWNAKMHEEVMKIDCGGAHRLWDFHPNNNGGAFVWTRASSLYVHAQAHIAHQTVQEGSHGREIKAMSVSPPLSLRLGETSQLIATGSEDTTIRISQYREAPGTHCKPGLSSLMCLSIIKKHTTGIQALQWSKCGSYLFSSGGFEEFFVWRIGFLPVIGIGYVCEAACPTQSNMPDLRITSFFVSEIFSPDTENEPGTTKFLISMVYSDSSLRVFSYDCGPRTFTLLLVGNYLGCCLTQVQPLFFSDNMVLCTASSDGRLVFWDIAKALPTLGLVIRGGQLHESVSEERAQAGIIKWQQRARVHQSSIKCLTVIPDGLSVLIVSGGDDNAMSFTHVVPNAEGEYALSCSTLLVPRAHACAVTAMAQLPPTWSSSHPESAKGAIRRYGIATSSNDQRLKLWSITIASKEGEGDTIDVGRRANMYSAVADISSMDLMGLMPLGPRIVLGGVGLDIWKI